MSEYTALPMRNGYTFVEMMIVLLAISLLIGAGFYSLKTYHDHVETRVFLKTLKKDLYFTQQTAVASEAYIQLSFHPDHTYTVKRGATVFKKVHYPEHISVEPLTMPLNIVYNTRGNITTGGKLLIRTPKKRINLVMQIGKGRFYFDER